MQISHDKFFWTAPVAAMAVTSTAKGIAPKFLLLGTAAGQVLPRSANEAWYIVDACAEVAAFQLCYVMSQD